MRVAAVQGRHQLQEPMTVVRRWKAPDLGLPVGRFAEPDDLLVLGSEPGQGLTAEVGEFFDRLL
jgi:hypothetical protein